MEGGGGREEGERVQPKLGYLFSVIYFKKQLIHIFGTNKSNIRYKYTNRWCTGIIAKTWYFRHPRRVTIVHSVGRIIS